MYRSIAPVLAVALILTGLQWAPTGAPQGPSLPSTPVTSAPAWTPADVDTSRDLHTVHAFNATHAWAGADHGVLYETTDAGDHWSAVHTGLYEPVTAMSWTDEDHGWIAGNDMEIRRTTDGGETWTQLTDGQMLGDFNDLTFLDAEHGFAVGSNALRQGYLLETTDGGDTWDPLPLSFPKTESNFHDVEFSPDGQTGWVLVSVFQQGFQVARTTDGGQTWTHHPLDTLSTPKDLEMATTDTGAIVGASGTVLHTTDGGRTWTTRATPTGSDLADLAFLDELQGWAVGSAGTVIATQDGGLSWSQEATQTAEPLEDVTFSPDGVGYAVGPSGTSHQRIGGDVGTVIEDQVPDLPPRIPHPPIVVSGDAGWGTPLSGVTSGSGTAEDPYVIAGWDLVPTGTPAITIQGTNAHVVIRDNLIHDAPNGETAIQLLDASNVRVADNRITATGAGIVADGGGPLEVEANTIEDTTSDGVEATNIADLAVDGNTIHSADGYGIEVQRSNAARIAQNTLSANQLGGVSLAGALGNPIVGVTVQANTFADDRYGLDASLTEDLHVEGNRFTLAETAGALLQRATDATITANQFLGNMQHGLLVQESTQLLVDGNTFAPRKTAARLEAPIDPTIRGNTFEHSREAALEIDQAAGGTIEQNTFDDVSMVARLTGASSDVTIHANNGSSHHWGIWLVDGSSGNQVTENTLHGFPDTGLPTMHEGVHVAGGDGNTIEGNTFDHVWVGVSVANQASGTDVLGNQLTHVGINGISVALYANETRIEGNTIEDVGDRGIFLLRRADDATIVDNTIRDVGGPAFEVQSSSHASIENNTIEDATWAAWFEWGCPRGETACDSAGNRFAHNTFTGLDRWIYSEPGFEGFPVYGTTRNMTWTANHVEGTAGLLDIGDVHGLDAHQNNLVGFTGTSQATTSTGIDLSQNWWGHTDGPTGTFDTDAETTVTVEPWLTEPVEDAGTVD